MVARITAVTCVSLLLLACGVSPPTRWNPSADLGADRAVVHMSTDCSAVLVGARTVLTAAHCVEDPGPYVVRIDSQHVGVLDCTVHPDAYDTPRACGEGRGSTLRAHDLALLTLGREVDVPPIPVLLTSPSLDPAWWEERTVRLVGWDRRPRLVGPLARRSGANRIVSVGADAFVTGPTEPGGFSTIIGDSGGPALVRVDGVERVAGILRGGPGRGSRRSVYAATFEAGNAQWLLRELPSDWGRDLADLDERAPFGGVTGSRTPR